MGAKNNFKAEAGMTRWGEGLKEISNEDCKEEFRSIEWKFAIIINKDVIKGIFHGGEENPAKERGMLKGTRWRHSDFVRRDSRCSLHQPHI